MSAMNWRRQENRVLLMLAWVGAVALCVALANALVSDWGIVPG
jgi:hypothetical protein